MAWIPSIIIMVGQRKKVTAVTFFRCPAVIMAMEHWYVYNVCIYHYDDVIMTMLASQITSLMVVYSIVYSGVNQRKHQSSASLAFVREIHRGPVNFPHKWPVTRKMFPFDDVIMFYLIDRKDDVVHENYFTVSFMQFVHPTDLESSLVKVMA